MLPYSIWELVWRKTYFVFKYLKIKEKELIFINKSYREQETLERIFRDKSNVLPLAETLKQYLCELF